MENYNCQVFPCKICCRTSQGIDARLIDCSKAATKGSSNGGGSPCGTCVPYSGSTDNFKGSLLVDSIAALISVQIVAGSVAVLIFGGIILHGFMGNGGCCASKEGLNTETKPTNDDKNPNGGGGGIFGMFGGGGDATASLSTNSAKGTAASAAGNVKVKAEGKFGMPTGTGAKPQPPQACLKIKYRDGKSIKGTVEKTFYLTISDEKKKKLVETSATFYIPSGEKPALVLTTDPIVLEDY